MKQTKSATKATPTNSTKRLESKRTHVENTNRGISTRRNKINSDKLKLNDKSNKNNVTFHKINKNKPKIKECKRYYYIVERIVNTYLNKNLNNNTRKGNKKKALPLKNNKNKKINSPEASKSLSNDECMEVDEKQSILKDEVFSIHQKNSVTTDKYNEKVLTNANNNIQKTNFYLENKSGYSLLQSKMDKILSNIKKNSHQPLFSEIENSKENQQKLISDSNILAEYYLEDRHLVMSPSKIDKLNKNDFSLELINIPDNVKKYITLKELLTK